MICRYCSQWNPDGTMRCCFCQNLVASEEDATISGTATYLAVTRHGGQPPPLLGDAPEGGEHGWRLDRNTLTALAVAAAALLLILLRWAC